MMKPAFECTSCGNTAAGLPDGYGGENAPKGWIRILVEDLSASRIMGSRRLLSVERLCPSCRDMSKFTRAPQIDGAALERARKG